MYFKALINKKFRIDLRWSGFFIPVASRYSGAGINAAPHFQQRYRSREQRESIAKFMARNCARSVSYNTIINHLPTMILFAASGPSVTYRDAPRTAGTIHHRDT